MSLLIKFSYHGLPVCQKLIGFLNDAILMRDSE